MESYRDVQQTELAWLAGILDGEGCISVHRNEKPQRDGLTTYFTWGMHVTITNSDARLLQRCIQIIIAITGRLPYIKLKCPGAGKNPLPTFNVRVQGKQDICGILEAVMPYLIGKKDQAQLMLAFINSTKGTGKQRIRNPKLASEVIEQMHQMKRLHANAEVTLAGLRSLGHRNEYGVSANDNPRTSVPPERENVL